MEQFCAACGNLGYPVKKTKGSIGVEALLLFSSVLAAAVNLVFGAAMFLLFVGYCVWRLSSKHLVCAECEGVNLIPPDSPMARTMVSQIYKAHH